MFPISAASSAVIGLLIESYVISKLAVNPAGGSKVRVGEAYKLGGGPFAALSDQRLKRGVKSLAGMAEPSNDADQRKALEPHGPGGKEISDGRDG